MYYLGIDCHKRFSYVTALDEAGQVKFKGKMSNSEEDFKALIEKLGDKCKATIETGYDWGLMYDMLQKIGVDVILAHAQKVKLITKSPIKTDKRDSMILAKLLKTDMIPMVYAPTKETRMKKAILRERMFYVKIRTMLKNKVHKVLYRNSISMDGYSDAFGKSGRKYISEAVLPETEKQILDNEMDSLDVVNSKIKIMETSIKKETKENRYVELIQTLPGFGEILSRVVALEIVDINRFANAKKLAAYSGVVPTEHSSSDTVFRGQIIKSCNKHIKEALIEGAWAAIRGSAYFRALYENVKSRRGGNKAVVAVARQIAEVIYHMLKEDRPFIERYVPNKIMAAL